VDKIKIYDLVRMVKAYVTFFDDLEDIADVHELSLPKDYDNTREGGFLVFADKGMIVRMLQIGDVSVGNDKEFGIRKVRYQTNVIKNLCVMMVEGTMFSEDVDGFGKGGIAIVSDMHFAFSGRSEDENQAILVYSLLKLGYVDKNRFEEIKKKTKNPYFEYELRVVIYNEVDTYLV